MGDSLKKEKTAFLAALVSGFYFTLLTAEHLLSAEALLRFGVSSAVLIVLFEHIIRLFPGIKIPGRQLRLPEKHFFLIAWAAFFICSLPAYLALFPGVFGYDSYKQMEFYTGLTVWDSHHPVLHTWLLGTILSLGKKLTGGYNGGVAIYCFLQLLLLSGAFALSLDHLKKKGAHPLLIIGAFLFLLFNPTIQLLSFNTTKDTLFGGVFLIFIIFWLRLLEGEKKAFIPFIISGTVSALLRNQGVYVLLVMLFIAAAVSIDKKNRERYKKPCLGIIIMIAAVMLFKLLCSSVFHIPGGEIREMLGVPMQQVAAVLKESEKEDGSAVLSEEQKAVAYSLITPDMVAAYDPATADPVKGGFDSARFLNEKGKYIKNYIALGLQNHGIYTDAWIAMIKPYWDMRRWEHHGLMAMQPDAEAWGIYEDSLIPAYGKLIKDMAVMGDYLWIPLLSWILNPGIYPWLLSFVLIKALVYKKGRWFMETLPGLLYFLTLMLGPMAMIRYPWPLLITMPLLFYTLTDGGGSYG
ncbi:MAG: hypothetical protein IKI75_08880 [Lachnospiraceae bacterium]|nr:hypothetical protein [Lachnospiraceae bacterium]